MSTPGYFHHQLLCPKREPPPPPTSPGDLLRPAGMSAPGSYGVTTFVLRPGVCGTLHVPSKGGVFVSPSPEDFLYWRSTGLQSQMLWGFLLLMPDPQTGDPYIRFRILTPMGEFLWYNYSSVCELPTRGYGIWLYLRCTPPTISLWFLPCLWM